MSSISASNPRVNLRYMPIGNRALIPGTAENKNARNVRRKELQKKIVMLGYMKSFEALD